MGLPVPLSPFEGLQRPGGNGKRDFAATLEKQEKEIPITNTNRPMKGTPTNLNVVDKATLIQMNPDDSESTSMNTKATAVLAVPMSVRIHQTSDSIKSDPNISNRTAKSEYTD